MSNAEAIIAYRPSILVAVAQRFRLNTIASFGFPVDGIARLEALF